MRGGIFYYSVTGNTALAVESLARRLPVPFELVDITRPLTVDAAAYDVVGFASPTDFWGVPLPVGEFIERLPLQDATPAFVMNTFGGVSGKTLPRFGSMVAARGFEVIAGYSLHMPDSYPPLLAWGIRAAAAPSERQLARFDRFASELSSLISTLDAGGRVQPGPLSIRLIDRLFREGARSGGRDAMGDRRIDAARCTRCGTCARDCPVSAIHLDPQPVFDAQACLGCWRCYNRCPSCAIRPAAYVGRAHYSGPGEKLKTRLGSARA